MSCNLGFDQTRWSCLVCSVSFRRINGKRKCKSCRTDTSRRKRRWEHMICEATSNYEENKTSLNLKESEGLLQWDCLECTLCMCGQCSWKVKITGCRWPCLWRKAQVLVCTRWSSRFCLSPISSKRETHSSTHRKRRWGSHCPVWQYLPIILHVNCLHSSFQIKRLMSRSLSGNTPPTYWMTEFDKKLRLLICEK